MPKTVAEKASAVPKMPIRLVRAFSQMGKRLSTKGTALQAAEKLGFVSGHDFSRAVND
jgi:hypothetical protein